MQERLSRVCNGMAEYRTYILRVRTRMHGGTNTPSSRNREAFRPPFFRLNTHHSLKSGGRLREAAP